MIKYRRKNISNKYFSIEIVDCPTEVFIFASNLGFKNVTIENFNNGPYPIDLTLSLNVDGEKLPIIPKRLSCDFTIKKCNFTKLKTLWDQQGCYAVFHDKTNISFKITDLEPIPRYRALDNFGWNLELAIPSKASDGWGEIVSPDYTIISLITSYIESLD